jgi:transposase
MVNIFSSINQPKRKNRVGRTITYQKITTKVLAKLFKVHQETMRRWIRESRFDPTDMLSIIEYYNKYNKLAASHTAQPASQEPTNSLILPEVG